MNSRICLLSLLACGLPFFSHCGEILEFRYRIDSKELESLVNPDWISLCISRENGDEFHYPAEKTSKPGQVFFSVPERKIENELMFVELSVGGLDSHRYALGEPVAIGGNQGWMFTFYSVALEIGLKDSMNAIRSLDGAQYMSGSVTLISEKNKYSARFGLDKDLKGKALLVSLPPGSYKALVSIFAQKDSRAVEKLEYEVTIEVQNSDKRSFEILVSDRDFRRKGGNKPIPKDEIERLRARPMDESKAGR